MGYIQIHFVSLLDCLTYKLYLESVGTRCSYQLLLLIFIRSNLLYTDNLKEVKYDTHRLLKAPSFTDYRS